MDITFTHLVDNISYIALFLIIIFIAKWCYHFASPYNTFNEVVEKKNVALATSIAGFIIAVTMIFISVLFGPSNGLLNDFLDIGLYSSLGIVMLFIANFINDKLLLSTFCNHKELIDNQSLPVGIAQAASFITAGLIISGALTGEGSLTSALIFYVLGQATLILFSKLYDFVTSFKLDKELERGNVAAAISFASVKIALGIILLHGLLGEFDSYIDSISLFFFDTLVALILLPIVRFSVDLVLLPKIKVDKAISENNIAVALTEGSIVICAALVIFSAL